MSECLDVPCIIRLLRNAHRPLDLAALMDDAATALERTQALPRVDDEMVERVARALCVDNEDIPDAISLNGKEEWRLYIEAAKAAIAAMPKPPVDGAMVNLLREVFMQLHPVMQRTTYHKVEAAIAALTTPDHPINNQPKGE